MLAQVDAILQSGLGAEAWIELHAAEWRAAHPLDDDFEEFDALLSDLENGV